MYIYQLAVFLLIGVTVVVVVWRLTNRRGDESGRGEDNASKAPCNKCGAALHAGAKFCQRCGHRV